jgi:hypothetical protein
MLHKFALLKYEHEDDDEDEDEPCRRRLLQLGAILAT